MLTSRFAAYHPNRLDLAQGLLFSVANWPLKGQEEFIERFKKRTNEPFLTQDGLCGYGHTMILNEALERAGAADKLKVAEAIRGLNLTEGPAASCFRGQSSSTTKAVGSTFQ